MTAGLAEDVDRPVGCDRRDHLVGRHVSEADRVEIGELRGWRTGGRRLPESGGRSNGREVQGHRTRSGRFRDDDVAGLVGPHHRRSARVVHALRSGARHEPTRCRRRRRRVVPEEVDHHVPAAVAVNADRRTGHRNGDEVRDGEIPIESGRVVDVGHRCLGTFLARRPHRPVTHSGRSHHRHVHHHRRDGPSRQHADGAGDRHRSFATGRQGGVAGVAGVQDADR